MNMKSSIVMMSLPPTNGVSGTETARAHPRHQSSGQNVREILGWKFALCVSCTGLMKQKEISIRDRVRYSRALCCRHRLKSYASQASFYESFYDTATLGTWLLDQERNGAIDSELAVLGSSIATACKQISTLVGRAGISDLMGLHGEINVQGEDQKKLDVVANEVFCAALRNSGRTGVLASEENEVPIAVEETNSGKYVVVFDPLDGSSNLDAAVATGSIFGIYAATTSCLPEDSEGTVEENCLANVCQPGSNLLAAGYCMYSSSTIMVISVGDGVYGFTLDPMIGEFVQSHERITIPEKGKIYSFNEGNYHSWSDGLKAYIDSLKTGGLEGGKPYSARYVGSLVADFHRTLLYGGIYGYPKDARNPCGKLRLLYECAPMSFLVEQAGGRGSTGTDRVLDMHPSGVHQRIPLFIGSKKEVDYVESFIAKDPVELMQFGFLPLRTSHVV